jgi:hypothetical protein
VSGNAQLFLALHRETGDAAWLEKARRFGEIVWSRRNAGGPHPAWPSGDGHAPGNPGLMTGNAGPGWLYLQLAGDGRLGGPVTP